MNANIRITKGTGYYGVNDQRLINSAELAIYIIPHVTQIHVSNKLINETLQGNSAY